MLESEIYNIDKSKLTINDNEINIKHYLMKKPGILISSFIVTDEFENWNGNGIYIENLQNKTKKKFIKYQYCILKGWGISENLEKYWILEDKNKTWKHGMYPLNKISCPDISIKYYDKIGIDIPWKDRKEFLGGCIFIKGNDKIEYFNEDNIGNEKLIIKYEDVYPNYVWGILFAFITIFIIRIYN